MSRSLEAVMRLAILLLVASFIVPGAASALALGPGTTSRHVYDYDGTPESRARAVVRPGTDLRHVYDATRQLRSNAGAASRASMSPVGRVPTAWRASARPDAHRFAPKPIPALRQAYVDDVSSIADDVGGWRKAGADPEFIAREAWANRRAVGIQYKDLTPADKLAEIHARNVQRYGDPLGPSVDWLRSRGKTWEQIIESATRAGGQDLGF